MPICRPSARDGAISTAAADLRPVPWPEPGRSATPISRRLRAFLAPPPGLPRRRRRAQVDDPVGGDHHLEAVLDDDQRMAAIDQRVQRLEQFDDVDGMETGGRLVEEEDRVRTSAGRG